VIEIVTLFLHKVVDLGEPRQGEKGISHKTRLRSRVSQCGPTDQSPPARIKVASGIRCKSAGVTASVWLREASQPGSSRSPDCRHSGWRQRRARRTTLPAKTAGATCAFGIWLRTAQPRYALYQPRHGAPGRSAGASIPA
jgi:hypothetical protein